MLHTEFEIPDPDRPLAIGDRGMVGPSGVLIPFTPKPIREPQVIRRRIVEWRKLGTYGMGEAGFVGFNFDTRPDEWLVIAVWGADNWMTLDGRLLGDEHPAQRDGEPAKWRPTWGSLDSDPPHSELFRDAAFETFEVSSQSLQAELDDGRTLRISDDATDRPRFIGNGRLRELEPWHDLRRSVFISPTRELWV